MTAQSADLPPGCIPESYAPCVGTGADESGDRNWPRRLHIAWSLVTIAATAALLLAIAHATKAQPGECNGIGFGCSLHGKDAAGFAAIFVVPVALALLVVGNAVIAVIGSASRKHEDTHTKAARYDEPW